MNFLNHEVNWKKVSIIGGAIIFIIAGLLLYFYLDKKEEKEVIVTESIKELETLIVDIDNREMEIDKIFSYIYDHLPYQHDMLDVQISNTLETYINNYEVETEQSTLNAVDALFAELLSGLKLDNVSRVLSTFHPDAYMNYLNSFETITAKDNGMAEFVQTLNRKNKLQEAGIIKDAKDVRHVRMVLKYSDGKNITIPLEMDAIEHYHTKKSDEFLVVTPFEDIMQFFN